MDRREARAALDGMSDVERRLAMEATRCPPWRHVAFGVVAAALVVSQGFTQPLQVMLFLTAMAALVWLNIDDRRRYGLFINGYRRGKTLPITLGLLGAMLAAMAAEIYARNSGLSLAIRLGIGAVACLVAITASMGWSRVYRRELIGGESCP